MKSNKCVIFSLLTWERISKRSWRSNLTVKNIHLIRKTKLQVFLSLMDNVESTLLTYMTIGEKNDDSLKAISF